MDSPLSMNQRFISELNDILEENYHDECFGVHQLAVAVGASRSSLHRKLNQAKGISTSEFIKQFRLKKAYELLHNNTSTVSEIAYSVGFSSLSYFSKCFHEHYDYSPSEVVKKKKKNLYATRDSEGMQISKRFSIHITAISLLLIVVSFSYWIFFNSSLAKEKTKSHLIAVLPFKTLGDDRSDQYFADGVMDVILSHLSSIKNFSVVSRTTMERYRETDKTIPEIANELGVSYVLEASVQKHDDMVRIIIQLIDARNDAHIWSDEYKRPFEDIFVLQSNIANEVAKQLEMKISPSQLNQIEQSNPDNFEAYNLYLKGRFFWHRRTEKDLQKSVHYFEQALEQDQNYAMAYAGLADAYFIMAWWGWYDMDQGYGKAKEYARKALSIHSDIASAYATLGGIATYNWNWNLAEKRFKQAIALDSNYATAYQYYAELLDILGRNDEAREKIDLALKFNPNSSAASNISSVIFHNRGEFRKAVKQLGESGEIKGVPWHSFYLRNYIRMDENSLAIEHLKAMCAKSAINEIEIDSLFKTSGIKEVVIYCMDSLSFHKREKYFNLGALSCFVGNTQRALDYLEMSYETQETLIPRIKNCIDFEPIRNEPRFIALLKKMNL